MSKDIIINNINLNTVIDDTIEGVAKASKIAVKVYILGTAASLKLFSAQVLKSAKKWEEDNVEKFEKVLLTPFEDLDPQEVFEEDMKAAQTVRPKRNRRRKPKKKVTETVYKVSDPEVPDDVREAVVNNDGL